MTDTERQDSGSCMNKERAGQGLPQAQLAEKIGVKSPPFIAGIENGDPRIPAARIEPYSKALRMARPTWIGGK